MVNIDSLEKNEALNEITKALLDLLTVKVKIDMNNPKYKYLHTNSFIWMKLDSEILLSNFDTIALALNSIDSRFSGYQKNRWYVVELTITNDGEKCIGELTLNPFASSNRTYKDNYLSLMEAYTNAIEQKNNANKSNSAKSTKATNKSDTSSKKSISQAINEVGKLMEKKKYKRYTFSDYNNFVKYGYGDCWAGAYFVACQLQKRGVTARIITYATKASSVHRSVQYKNEKGNWVNFPYDNFNIDKNFKAYKSSGRVIKNNCPKNI